MTNTNILLDSIATSILEDRVVHLAYTYALEIGLDEACDASAKTETAHEYWGCDDAGSDWRIHLIAEDE